MLVICNTSIWEDDNPTEGRSSSIEYSKKEISFFMPNRLAHWYVRTKSGNPTKSVTLNDLIKKVKNKEVRKQGKMSYARRLLNISEFVEMINRLRSERALFSRYTVVTYFIFQLLIIFV